MESKNIAYPLGNRKVYGDLTIRIPPKVVGTILIGGHNVSTSHGIPMVAGDELKLSNIRNVNEIYCMALDKKSQRVIWFFMGPKNEVIT
jgi:hypothetical protein